jgi:Transposase
MTMKTTTRRSFTDEFKQEAVSLLASSGRPLTQIATKLGIQPSMLRSWRGTVTGRCCGYLAPRVWGRQWLHRLSNPRSVVCGAILSELRWNVIF